MAGTTFISCTLVRCGLKPLALGCHSHYPAVRQTPPNLSGFAVMTWLAIKRNCQLRIVIDSATAGVISLVDHLRFLFVLVLRSGGDAGKRFTRSALRERCPSDQAIEMNKVARPTKRKPALG